MTKASLSACYTTLAVLQSSIIILWQIREEKIIYQFVFDIMNYNAHSVYFLLRMKTVYR